MIYRHKLISYLLVGKLLHFITVIEIAAILLILPVLPVFIDEPNIILLVLKICLLLYLFSLPVSAQLDARSRFQNYKQIKDQLYFNGFQERILKPVSKSRCQRDAAMVAAKELGLGDQSLQYLKSAGYSWYQLMPDWIFRKPQYLLSKYFIKTTFFAPTYHAKVNYRQLKMYDSVEVKIFPFVYERAS